MQTRDFRIASLSAVIWLVVSERSLPQPDQMATEVFSEAVRNRVAFFDRKYQA